jgi:hypothetical protein
LRPAWAAQGDLVSKQNKIKQERKTEGKKVLCFMTKVTHISAGKGMSSINGAR